MNGSGGTLVNTGSRGWWFAGLDKASWIVFMIIVSAANTEKISLPLFKDLRAHYPGYYHHEGKYRNHELLHLIGVPSNNNLLLHDTSALRLSYSLNKIGGQHSLGKELIRLSRFGHDSIQGSNELQYIFLPISFGPYLADKYGYPNITKLHQENPGQTRHAFWSKQGILRVITYTEHGNQPKGHVALWDCDHFHESKDWISESKFLTVEFWESPDSTCPEELVSSAPRYTIIPRLPIHSADTSLKTPDDSLKSVPAGDTNTMSHSNSRKSKYLKHVLMPTNARHSSKKMRERLQTG